MNKSASDKMALAS